MIAGQSFLHSLWFQDLTYFIRNMMNMIINWCSVCIYLTGNCLCRSECWHLSSGLFLVHWVSPSLSISTVSFDLTASVYPKSVSLNVTSLHMILLMFLIKHPVSFGLFAVATKHSFSDFLSNFCCWVFGTLANATHPTLLAGWVWQSWITSLVFDLEELVCQHLVLDVVV